MTTDKNEKKSVSFPPALLKAALEKAKEPPFRGNLSAYIQALMERDLQGGDWPAPVEGALDVFASKFWPPGYGSFHSWKIEEPDLLAHIIHALAHMAQELPHKQPSLVTADAQTQQISVLFGKVEKASPINILLNGLESDTRLSVVEEPAGAYMASHDYDVTALKPTERPAFQSTLAAPRQHEEELPAPTGVVETLRAQAGKSTETPSKQPATPDPTAPARKGASPGKQAR
jgi:hypothetical protein